MEDATGSVAQSTGPHFSHSYNLWDAVAIVYVVCVTVVEETLTYSMWKGAEQDICGTSVANKDDKSEKEESEIECFASLSPGSSETYDWEVISAAILSDIL